jgi:hypothetical protein
MRLACAGLTGWGARLMANACLVPERHCSSNNALRTSLVLVVADQSESIRIHRHFLVGRRGWLGRKGHDRGAEHERLHQVCG